MNKFEIEPAFCAPLVTYDLTSVIGPDGGEYLATLLIDFDGVYNGDANEGSLSVSAIIPQYIDGTIPAGTYTFLVTATGEGG